MEGYCIKKTIDFTVFLKFRGNERPSGISPVIQPAQGDRAAVRRPDAAGPASAEVALTDELAVVVELRLRAGQLRARTNEEPHSMNECSILQRMRRPYKVVSVKRPTDPSQLSARLSKLSALSDRHRRTIDRPNLGKKRSPTTRSLFFLRGVA